MKNLACCFLLFFCLFSCQLHLGSTNHQKKRDRTYAFTVVKNQTDLFTLKYINIDLQITCKMEEDTILEITQIISESKPLSRFNIEERPALNELISELNLTDKALLFRINEMFGNDTEKIHSEYRKLYKTYLEFNIHRYGVFNEGVAIIKYQNKFGFINRKGQVVIDFIYENATNFADNKAKVKQNGTWQMISFPNE